ncbi:hypothetical protein AB0J28_05590 [Streptosporangium canum]|uniref:hypothetical protein n=1 Tax=Streptosporangium canum TaxID=324952 RepID=UPI003447A0C8
MALRLGTTTAPPVQARSQPAELDALTEARLRYDTAGHEGCVSEGRVSVSPGAV